MICPNCEKKMNITEIVSDWENGHGADSMPTDNAPLCIGADCQNCEEFSVLVKIEKAGELTTISTSDGEEIEIPKSLVPDDAECEVETIEKED
jgi:hypothetical protein